MTAPEISLPPGADPPVGGDSTPALPWADSHGNTAGRAPIVVARFTVDGEPVSKARPRFATKGSKNQTYTPQKTRDAEQVVAWKFRATAPGHKPNSEHTYGVTALFVSGTRHRRDVDNMLKLILDGLNKVAWADDDQVVEVSGRKTYEPLSRDHARTEVVVYRVGSVQRKTGGETPISSRPDLLQAAQVSTFFPHATDEQIAAFLARFELTERPS